MENEAIHLVRIRKFIDRLEPYCDPQPLAASYIHHPDTPIPYSEALSGDYLPIAPGEVWGTTWVCAWFRLNGIIPAHFAGNEVAALVDLDGEGCVFKEDTPWIGLSGRLDHYAESAKTLVPLCGSAGGGESISLLIEAGANTLFGEGKREYRLQRADLVIVDRGILGLKHDCRILFDLAKVLPERSPRRQKILRGLDDVANAWQAGQGLDDCRRITAHLLLSPAYASAPTAWSIGHAHIDLAWLWPVRETKRKGGRTFATALRLLERYPEYRFGASQPQLYQWMKDLYPALYDQIRARVTEGRWECQGGTWVEMDTQLPAGESLVRQFLYGLRFFAEEFGQRPDYLFLPDCFGFSAALPQIIRKCGLHAFLTQKMSWNETNPFPHHTFTWEGIDGSRVLTHFLPTNDYNGSNLPDQLVEAERRYAQNDVSDDFMNLFGIGDGGGGPAESHIEYALRQTNLEGVPKMRIDSVQAFFRRLSHIPPERLPRWTGELYLELHRGTYTTQARMKRWNRRIEHALHDLELLAALWGGVDKPELDALWHDTLLHQFHDILPGSSIGWVYKDAEALSATNHTRIEELIRSILSRQFNTTDTSTTFVVLNTLGYPRTEYIELPATGIVRDSAGRALPSAERDGKTEALVSVPAYGYTTITIDGEAESVPTVRFEPDVLENDLLRLEFGADGSITRIYDRLSGREWLSGPANRFQLWEDLPNKWGAWDINHFYRDTVPEPARLLEAVTLPGNGLSAIRRQKLSVGKSTIEQEIRLVRGSRLIHCSLRIDWQETYRMLRVSAEPAVRAETAAYEIQFGTLHRPARTNTSWDRARFEGVAHRFIDLSQPDAGFAVLNDGKYGHSVIDNRMEINILRSPADVDPTADMGLQELTFAYYPHAGTLSSSDTIAVAHTLNVPLRLLPVQQAPNIPETSFFSLAGSGVKIETVKPAEDGKGVILRLYETFGGNAAVTLQTNTPWVILLETDLLEKPLDLQQPAGDSVELAFKPFEIRTFRLQYTDQS